MGKAKNGPSTAASSLPPRPPVDMVTSTIRGQAKQEKKHVKVDKGTTDAGAIIPKERAMMDNEVVKAVLASPLTVPWPKIPDHLQDAVMHNLPILVPQAIADFHLSRARTHTASQKEKRRQKREDGRKETTGVDVTETAGRSVVSAVGGEDDGQGEDASTGTPRLRKRTTHDDTLPPAKKPKTIKDISPTAIPKVPGLPLVKPDILNHIVFGINETIKTLERQIDDLKLRILIMSDTLNGTLTPRKPDTLLPTAPAAASPATESADRSIVFIIIPLLSISPQSLVSPIPQYCATYNTLVFQHAHLTKIFKTRLKQSHWHEFGVEPEEVRVVPLGNREAQMAAAAGLRRLACMGVRNSHPHIDVLHKLLPKSKLVPPRLSLTLPLPTSAIHIHQNAKTPRNIGGKGASAAPLAAPVPIQYAPLHVKGITTTIPADGHARKQKRLAEVRQTRAARKEQKRLIRTGLVKKHGRGGGKAKPWKGRENAKDVTARIVGQTDESL